jgi:hypothetical protein
MRMHRTITLIVTVILSACTPGQTRSCSLQDASSYVSDGRTRVLAELHRRGAANEPMTDGRSTLTPEEMTRIQDSDLAFVSASADGTPELLGFSLLYRYRGTEFWQFIVTYDRRCNSTIGWQRVRM